MWGVGRERRREGEGKHSRQKNNNQRAGRTKRIQGEAREIRQDLPRHGKSCVIYPKSNSEALKVISEGNDIITSI